MMFEQSSIRIIKSINNKIKFYSNRIWELINVLITCKGFKFHKAVIIISLIRLRSLIECLMFIMLLFFVLLSNANRPKNAFLLRYSGNLRQHFGYPIYFI